MNKHIVYSAIFLFLLASCGGQKELAKKDKDSVKLNIPYIEAFHKGVRLKATGRIEESIAKFEECLTMRQDDDAVYYALSKLELMRNNENASAEYIIKAAEIDPSNKWYTEEVAYMYLSRKDYPNAIKNFDKLIKLEPDNVVWLYGLAQAHMEGGSLVKCMEAMNRIEDVQGLSPDVSLQKYSIYMDAGKKDEALNELKRAREEFPEDASLIGTMVDYYYQTNQPDEAANMLEKLVEADPTNGRAHLALADIYQREGDEAKMYESLRMAFRSDDVDIDAKMAILIKIHESGIEIDKEFYELVDILLEKYPSDPKSHSIHGDYLLTQNKNEEALSAYKKALEFGGNQYPIWNQVLLMEYEQSKNEDLYNDSKTCLDLYPSVVMIYLFNGVGANQTKRYAEALEVLTAGRELIFNDPAMEAEFHGQMGDASFGLKQLSDGKEHYKKALQVDPKSLLLKNNFALRLATANTDLELAESLIKQVLEKAGNEAQFLDTYGWVLFQKMDFNGAKTQFEVAHSLNKIDAIILEHLGDAHFKLGNLNEALIWWAKAQAAKPNDLLNKKISDKKYYAPEF
jgi:tetratricopeptide (TPR) repeat protein